MLFENRILGQSQSEKSNCEASSLVIASVPCCARFTNTILTVRLLHINWEQSRNGAVRECMQYLEKMHDLKVIDHFQIMLSSPNDRMHMNKF